MSMNPSPWPHYSEEEISAVNEVLKIGKVNYWTGRQVQQFEQEYAKYVGVKHAIAMMNGTVTLEAALAALNIGPGDEVIIPSHTFIATASAVIMRGAKPVVADVCSETNNLTIEEILPCINSATKAIIVVHLGGHPCDMDSIMHLARQHNLKVIEDCAQSHGAKYKGKPVGSFGDIASFSFCQDKIISTGGEGGMVVTNDEGYWRTMWSMKDHGKCYDAVYNHEHSEGFRWVHKSFGTNWRMTEMQAAIGRIQLRKLDSWVVARQKNAKLFISTLGQHHCLRVTEPSNDIHHSYYRLYTFIKHEYLKDGWSRDKIIQELNNLGVVCFWGGCSEIYREKAFSSVGLAPKQRLPNAKAQGESAIVFLTHPTLTEAEITTAALKFREILLTAGVSYN